MSQLWSKMSFVERRNNLSDNMTSSKSAENLKSDQQRQRNNEDEIAKMFYGQDFPKNQSILSSSTPNLSNPNDGSSRLMPLLRPLQKYFYLPEEKIHSNELVKIHQHFDKSYDKHYSSGISNKSDKVGHGKIGKTKNQITFSEIKGGNISSSLNECTEELSQTTELFDASLNLEPFRITAPPLIKNNSLLSCSDARCRGNEMDFTQENINEDRKHRFEGTNWGRGWGGFSKHRVERLEY